MIRTLLPALMLSMASHLAAQDSNVLWRTAHIETRLRESAINIVDMRGSRWEHDRTQRVMLSFPDSSVMLVKWAKAPFLGSAFNNQPRYEAAAYEFQKLFLDEEDFVVPPTIIRAVPLSFYRGLDRSADATFRNTSSVVVVLQYWLSQVLAHKAVDPLRFDSDMRYAYHLANTNVFSYLVHHSDSNTGNFLVSSDTSNPRVFAVDNGVAFGYETSDRGTAWRDLLVKRVPAKSVERLRKITSQDLRNALGVVAQFEILDGELIAVSPTANLNPSKGVRKTGKIVQFGLTEREILEIEARIGRLLKRVDDGKLGTF